MIQKLGNGMRRNCRMIPSAIVNNYEEKKHEEH
jgi:hypothetical protein